MEESNAKKALYKNSRYTEIREAYDQFREVVEAAKQSDKSVWDEFDHIEEAKKELSQVLKKFVREARYGADTLLKKEPAPQEAQDATEDKEEIKEEEVTGA